MEISSEMRLLFNKWQARDTNTTWPKWLDWVEIKDLRGWKEQRIDFRFPIVAVVGENGSGKSTILQSAASVYQAPDSSLSKFASDYFPDTIWDSNNDVIIRFSYQEGGRKLSSSIRKPTDRWRGNTKRPKRHVKYVDLGRLQPVSARTGYKRLANPLLKEISAAEFEKNNVERLSEIIGRKYQSVKMALTNADSKRAVPVITGQGVRYSGFHQGAGELTIAELLQVEPIPSSLILIDEIETSLHPLAQRRLIRDLAEKCRRLDLQIILTTHSPYILEELPTEGRICIIEGTEKRIAYGVSPEYALTKMDESPHQECDIYVEDDRSIVLLREIFIAHAARKEDILRCGFISYGAASVGASLGQMIEGKKFPRPSCVYLDGDQAEKPGCYLLPGNDAPERVVFNELQQLNWDGVSERVDRSPSNVIDACQRATTSANHHDWLRLAADQLIIGSDILWQALCSCWVKKCLDESIGKTTVRPIEEVLVGPSKISSTFPKSLL